MTIPSDVLKMLNVEVGASLELDGARPARPAARKRYTLAELLCGALPKDLAALQLDTGVQPHVPREPEGLPSGDSRRVLNEPESLATHTNS